MNLQYMTAKPIQTSGLLLEKNFDKNATFKLIWVLYLFSQVWAKCLVSEIRKEILGLSLCIWSSFTSEQVLHSLPTLCDYSYLPQQQSTSLECLLKPEMPPSKKNLPSTFQLTQSSLSLARKFVFPHAFSRADSILFCLVWW